MFLGKTLYSHSASFNPDKNKWLPADLSLGGNPAMDQHLIQESVEIFLVASCYGNRDKLRPDGPLGSYTEVLKGSGKLSTVLFSQYCL